MTSAVRFSGAHARLRAMKSRLWSPLDRPLLVTAGLEPDGRPLTGDSRETWGPLVRWYATLLEIYPSGTALFRALLRRHEIENLKLLWRAALRGRVPEAACWRALEPLAALTRPARAETIDELVHRLAATPYGAIARTLLGRGATNLPATEIGLDRWAWTAIWQEASRLPRREAAARDLVRLLLLEHDFNLLRRGAAFGLPPDLIAKSTIVLSKQARAGTPFAEAPAPTWESEQMRLRRARLRACRRAFTAWPFQLGPAVAALLLREEQTQAALAIAAARRGLVPARDALALALAAGPLEPRPC